MMTQDPEIAAMGAIVDALSELEEDARTRALGWAAQRYGVKLVTGAGSRGGIAPGLTAEDAGSGSTSEEYGDFVDLFHAADPKTDADKTLVGGYWFQVVHGRSSFTGQEVNGALKDLGQGVGNITNATSNLQGRKPALVRQMAKSGRTQQARKTYKLTAEGVTAVRKMINGPAGTE